MQQVQHKPEHKACAARVSTSRCHQVQQKARCSRFSTSQNIRHALRGSAQADAIRFSTSRCNKARCSRFSASRCNKACAATIQVAVMGHVMTMPHSVQKRLRHTVCENITQCAKTSHSVQKNHTVCENVTQCAKTSHSVQKHHAVCKYITQCAKTSHSVQIHHTVCKNNYII